MNKFALDLSKFKKIETNEKTSTLKNQDGHEIKIDHKKLPRHLKTKLDELPLDKNIQKFPEGGEVSPDLSEADEPNEITPQDATPAGNYTPPNTQMPSDIQALIPNPNNSPSSPPDQAAQLAPTQPIPSTPPNDPNDPFQFQSLGQKQVESLGQQQAGAEAKVTAEAAPYQGIIKAQQAKQDADVKAYNTFDATNKMLLNSRQDLQQAIQDQQIDPQKYINDMSTGKHIATGLGLILGGMGAGLTHGPNLAFQYLQNQIDRDIDSQKAELGKKENLLSHNFQATQDLRSAYDLTRIHTNDILSDQLGKLAATTINPVAKANLLSIQGQFGQQSAQLQQQIAIQKARLGSQESNGQQDPAKLVPALVPPEHQKTVFAEIERAQNVKRVSTEIMNAYDKAADAMSGIGGTALSLVRKPRELNILGGLLNTTVSDLTGTARQAEFDSVAQNFMPNNYDTPANKVMKRQGLQNYVQAKMSAPTAKAFGIDLQKFGSTAAPGAQQLNAQQQKFATWAKNNPGPKADMVLKKLGMQ